MGPTTFPSSLPNQSTILNHQSDRIERASTLSDPCRAPPPPPLPPPHRFVRFVDSVRCFPPQITASRMASSAPAPQSQPLPKPTRVSLSYEEISKLFSLPIAEAASILGMAPAPASPSVSLALRCFHPVHGFAPLAHPICRSLHQCLEEDLPQLRDC